MNQRHPSRLADRPLAGTTRDPRAHSLDALLTSPFDLIPRQRQFFDCPARFSFYVGGIGSGKTTAGCLRALRLAAMQPGSLGLIGAPTYTMLRDTTQRMLLHLLPPWAIASYRQTDHHLTLINGSEILFRSIDDPDRLRDLNLAWFWLDEAPLCGHYAWQILKGRLRQAGFHTTAMATGTPHGRDAYWHDFEDEPRPDHTLIRATTADNAEHLPTDFIADLGLTGVYYEQEVLGQFTAFDGLVYQPDAGPDGNLRDPSSTADSDGAAKAQRAQSAAKADATHAWPEEAQMLHEGNEGQRRSTQDERANVRDAKGISEAASTPGLQAGSASIPASLVPVNPAESTTTSSATPLNSVSISPASALREPSRPSRLRGASASTSDSAPDRFVEVIGGIDWGYTNPAVGLVLARDGDDRWWLLEEFYQRRAALDAVLLPALIDLTRRHRVTTWYAGPDDPGAIAAFAAALAREQLPAKVRKADNAVRQGIQTVTGLLAPRDDGTRGLYIAPRCVHTLSEFHTYADASLPNSCAASARPAAEEPIKQNDHALDALRYALHTAVSRHRRYTHQLDTLRQRQRQCLDPPRTP